MSPQWAAVCGRVESRLADRVDAVDIVRRQDFVCGEQRLPRDQWHVTSMPCDAGMLAEEGIGEFHGPVDIEDLLGLCLTY